MWHHVAWHHPPPPHPPTPPPLQELRGNIRVYCRIRPALTDAERASVVVEEAPTARPVMQRHLPILEPETFYTMCSGGLGHSLGLAGGPLAAARAALGQGPAWWCERG